MPPPSLFSGASPPMADELPPSLFTILREDIASMRIEWAQRFENLVTREAFTDERRRVDGRLQDMSREIGELKTNLSQEAQARVAAQQDTLQAQIREKNEREKVRRATAWQWFALAVSVVIGPIVGGLIGAALSATGVAP